jgi:hypothetical protein
MEMADVILVFHPGQCAQMDDEALAICFGATNVERPAPGVIACTVPAGRIHQLEHDPRVAYVRRVHVYLGSYGS